MARHLSISLICLCLILPSGGLGEDQTITAPSFDGVILGIHVQAESLGVVLDISESMQRTLPAVRALLLDKLPKTPVLHVDGCALEKPGPRATVKGGVATETVTAVDLLGEFANATAVLWISDMGDPPNHAGIEAMVEMLNKHGITLYLLSLKNQPGPSLRKIVEGTEGTWKVVSLESSGEG